MTPSERYVELSPIEDAPTSDDVAAVAQHVDVAFEQAAIGMALVDFKGAFLAVNPALCALLCRSEQDLLGLRWQSITHPEDVSRGENEVARVTAGDADVFTLAKRYVRPDNQLVWVLLSVSPIRDQAGEPICLFTQVVDITDKQRAEEELARLASIVESSDDAIISIEFDGTVFTWNRAAERMYGYSAAEMIGKNMSMIVPPSRCDEARQLIARIRHGEPVRNFETERLRSDRSIIDVSVTVSPIFDASGTAVRISSIARDITEQKRMSATLDHTLAALEAALDETRNSEAKSRAFLSDAAHHLRNPVAGIRACVEALLRGADPEGEERLLREIARETWRTSRLVDRLLRIARLDQGEPLVLEGRDVVELCRDEVGRARSLAPHLAISMTGDGPLALSIDRQAVREIVGSLLENARRHALRRIDVTVAEVDAAVEVRVADDGGGLFIEDRARVFEPFVSLDGQGGFGLGLTVSRALARAQGGDLTYEDEAFVLRVPNEHESRDASRTL